MRSPARTLARTGASSATQGPDRRCGPWVGVALPQTTRGSVQMPGRSAPPAFSGTTATGSPACGTRPTAVPGRPRLGPAGDPPVSPAARPAHLSHPGPLPGYQLAENATGASRRALLEVPKACASTSSTGEDLDLSLKAPLPLRWRWPVAGTPLRLTTARAVRCARRRVRPRCQTHRSAGRRAR
jgi:hypothetical protein